MIRYAAFLFLTSCATLIAGTDISQPPDEIDGWERNTCFKSKPEYGEACCLYTSEARWVVICTGGDDWEISEHGDEGDTGQTL